MEAAVAAAVGENELSCFVRVSFSHGFGFKQNGEKQKVDRQPGNVLEGGGFESRIPK